MGEVAYRNDAIWPASSFPPLISKISKGIGEVPSLSSFREILVVTNLTKKLDRAELHGRSRMRRVPRLSDEEIRLGVLDVIDSRP